MAATSTSIEEKGLLEGLMPAWTNKKGKSLSRAEMLWIFNSVMKAYTAVFISNGTKSFDE